MANNLRDPKLEGRWRDALHRQRSSGLTVQSFCKREGLSESSFYAWRRTIAERDGAARSTAAPLFLPVTLKAASKGTPIPSVRASAQSLNAHHAMVIELRGGRALRLPESMPVSQVVALVHALEAGEQS